MSNVWRDALVATAIVSILPNLLLVFIPSSFFQPAAKGKKQSINWSNLLLCFAIAGLLGDVFLHILPHMMGAHSHDHHDHQHELASHGSFLHEDTHEHDHEEHEEDMHHHDHEHEHEHEHKHEHEHNHGDDSRSLLSHSKSFYDMIGFERSIVVQTTVLFGFFIFFLAEKLAKSFMNEDEGDEDNHSHNHSHAKNDKATADNVPKGFFATLKHKLAAAGWLNLLADSMHNFTDGIAIGAAFATGNRLRVATFLSVILHEIPHEIGDFTILVQSGLSKSEAIQAQFVTAIAAFVGTIVGLLADRNQVFEDLLLAMTAGGFVYIATVSSVPMILKEKSSLMEIVGLCVMFGLGIAMMILVTYFE